MKKLFIMVAAFVLSCNLFAQEVKTYAAFDYNFCLGNTTLTSALDSSSSTYDTTRQGFDFDVAFYLFPNLGAYANFANNFIMKPEEFGCDSGFKFDFGVGLTYRQEIGNNLEWTIGVGPHISNLSLKFAPDHEYQFNSIGVAANAGVRYTLFDIVFLNAGIAGHYDFSTMAVTLDGNDFTDIISGVNALDAKAYIGVGLIITELF